MTYILYWQIKQLLNMTFHYIHIPLRYGFGNHAHTSGSSSGQRAGGDNKANVLGLNCVRSVRCQVQIVLGLLDPANTFFFACFLD